MSTHRIPAFTDTRLPAGVEPPTRTDPEHLGAYRVVGRIGAGGMGAVYAGLAEDGSPAAVKVVHPQFAADPEFRERFAREVELVSRVQARCTPSFLGADSRAATPWLATEYVPGLTLRQYVREHGPLSGGLLTALAVGLAEALVAIHGAGVVHRDLKPGNVILAPDGPKVLDFGIARATDGTALTATGGMLGTPGWVAPEQYLGQEATGDADLFAWAGLVLFAATGRDAFGTGQADVLSYRVRNEEPDLSGLAEPLVGPVRAAFAKDPGQRPTAAEVLAELTGSWNATRVEPVAAADPTQVVPGLLASEWQGISAPETVRVRGRRSGRWLAVGSATLTLALVAGGTFVWPGDGVPALGLLGIGSGSDPAPGDQGALADPGGESTDTGLAVDQAPQDWRAVLGEALELADGARSFEVYQRSTHAAAHGQFIVHRYTEEPQPILYLVGYGGPAYTETLSVGEGLEDSFSRTVSMAPDAEVGPYVRTPDSETGEEPEAEGWPFLPPVAELLEPEARAEAEYMGVTEAVQSDTAWNWDHFETEAEYGSAHHYSGSYYREGFTGDGITEVEHGFDLWIGQDGRFQRFERFRDYSVDVEEDFGGSEGWEIVVVSFDQPVQIEVPDESEILASRDHG